MKVKRFYIKDCNIQYQTHICERCAGGFYFNEAFRECLKQDNIVINCKTYSLYDSSVCVECFDSFHLVDGNCESQNYILKCISYDEQNKCLGIFYIILYFIEIYYIYFFFISLKKCI